MDRLFLDANALFSAAYREDAGVRRLWDLPEAELVTSAYAVEEARRNLDTGERRPDLGGLLEAVRVSNLLADPTHYPEIEASGLPEKDLPILRAAVASGATYLVTGDCKHFGHLFGQEVAGVLVLRPAELLATRTEEPAATRQVDGLHVEVRRLSPYAAKGAPRRWRRPRDRSRSRPPPVRPPAPFLGPERTSGSALGFSGYHGMLRLARVRERP